MLIKSNIALYYVVYGEIKIHYLLSSTVWIEQLLNWLVYLFIYLFMYKGEVRVIKTSLPLKSD